MIVGKPYILPLCVIFSYRISNLPARTADPRTISALFSGEQAKSDQIKFISSKPKYNITKTKTIQLISYGVRKVLKRHWYLPPKCSNRYKQRKYSIGK